MNSFLKFRLIELRTHAHATESLEKVQEALQNIVPFEIEPSMLQVDNCSGTHGQRISNFVLKISRKAEIMATIEFFAQNFSKELKFHLYNTFFNRVDHKNKFYFRLDKQAAFLKRVEMKDTKDVIQILIAVQNRNPKEPTTVEKLRSYFEFHQLLRKEE